MKIKSLAAAVAVLGSAQAFALTPSTTPDVQVNISGASAQQKTLGKMLGNYCQAGTLDTFYDGAAGANYRNYFCTFKNDASVKASLRNKKVLIRNRAKGGSVWGVAPVARGWNVEFLNSTASNCTDANSDKIWECSISTRSTAVVPATGECPQNSSNLTANDQQTTCRVTDGGVSDVESGLFVGTNLPSGWTALTPGELGGITTASQYGVVFGVAVTNDVYDALVDAGKVSASGTASLTKAEVASIYRGDVQNWDSLDDALVEPGVSGPGGTYGTLTVCRRGDGSGTQASQQAFFLNYPCASGTPGGQQNFVGAQDLGTYTVIANSSTGNVATCMNAALAGTNNSALFTSGAVGLIPLERPPVAGTDNWKFVAIDGIGPTEANARSGKYQNVFEQTMQWRNSLDATKKDLMTMVRDGSGDPAIMTAAGLVGVIALPGVGTNDPLTNPLVSRATRNGNSCAPVTVVPGTPAI